MGAPHDRHCWNGRSLVMPQPMHPPPDREIAMQCTTRSRDLAMIACVKSGASASHQVRLTALAFVMHIGMYSITLGRRSGSSGNSFCMLLNAQGGGAFG